jgi:hypothetical protein
MSVLDRVVAKRHPVCGYALAIIRLASLQPMFIEPLAADGAEVLPTIAVPYSAHQQPDRNQNTTDAHPDHPRHAPHRR